MSHEGSHRSSPHACDRVQGHCSEYELRGGITLMLFLGLCLHEKFQPGSSSARVESLYDRQKRRAFT